LSRNKERLGGVQQRDTNPPQPAMQADSGGFSFVVPTEFVELPSGGRFYPEGHPLHGQESIEIRQMTAKEEDILTSRTLLKKGVALDRVIENLIVNKRIDPYSLLVGDRNAIIVATRVSGYGNMYETKVTCPSCDTNQEYNFNLNDAHIYCGENIATLEVVDNNNGTFNVELPKTGVTVTFKLLCGKDEKRLLAGIENDRKRKNERHVTRQLVNIVVAVNGDNSPDAINYLIENIPSMDSRHIRLSYRLAAPTLDLTQSFECSECGHEQDMEVPLTADFFWPDR
jgi:hypothetical protein